MNLNFCNQKDRCSICGGALDGYELHHEYSFHLNKNKCIDVLQNTIIGLSENDNHNFKMLSYLLKDFSQEQIDKLEKIIQKEDK